MGFCQLVFGMPVPVWGKPDLVFGMPVPVRGKPDLIFGMPVPVRDGRSFFPVVVVPVRDGRSFFRLALSRCGTARFFSSLLFVSPRAKRFHQEDMCIWISDFNLFLAANIRKKPRPRCSQLRFSSCVSIFLTFPGPVVTKVSQKCNKRSVPALHGYFILPEFCSFGMALDIILRISLCSSAYWLFSSSSSFNR